MGQQTFSLGTWWAQGGVVMYPLALYSLLLLAILIEKLIFIRKIGGKEAESVREAAAGVRMGDTKTPSGDTPVYKILNYIGKLAKDGVKTESLLRSAEREVARIEDIAMRGMIWLAIIGNTSPFVGLFGTVVGIIRAFHGLSAQGLMTNPAGNPELIRGIAEALVATATGLLVAIPAVICYNFLLREIRSRITRLDLACADYAEALGNTRESTK